MQAAFAYRSVKIGPKLRSLRLEAIPHLEQSRMLRELCERRGGQLHTFQPQRMGGCRDCHRPHEEHVLDAAVGSTWEGGNRYRAVPGKYLPDIAAIFTLHLRREVTVSELAPEAIIVDGVPWRQLPPDRPSVEVVDELPELEPPPHVPLSLATVSGYLVGGALGRGPGSPGRLPAGGTMWVLLCRRCGAPHAQALGEHAPRTCDQCGEPLAAQVTCRLGHSQEW